MIMMKMVVTLIVCNIYNCKRLRTFRLYQDSTVETPFVSQSMGWFMNNFL